MTNLNKKLKKQGGEYKVVKVSNRSIEKELNKWSKNGWCLSDTFTTEGHQTSNIYLVLKKKDEQTLKAVTELIDERIEERVEHFERNCDALQTCKDLTVKELKSLKNNLKEIYE